MIAKFEKKYNAGANAFGAPAVSPAANIVGAPAANAFGAPAQQGSPQRGPKKTRVRKAARNQLARAEREAARRLRVQHAFEEVDAQRAERVDAVVPGEAEQRVRARQVELDLAAVEELEHELSRHGRERVSSRLAILEV